MINLHLDDLAQDYPVPVYSVWIFHTHWCWNLLKGRWDPVGFLLNSESQLMTEASILDDVSVHRWSVIFTPLAYQFHWGNKLIFLELFLEWQTSYIHSDIYFTFDLTVSCLNLSFYYCLMNKYEQYNPICKFCDLPNRFL